MNSYHWFTLQMYTRARAEARSQELAVTAAAQGVREQEAGARAQTRVRCTLSHLGTAVLFPFPTQTWSPTHCPHGLSIGVWGRGANCCSSSCVGPRLCQEHLVPCTARKALVAEGLGMPVRASTEENLCRGLAGAGQLPGGYSEGRMGTGVDLRPDGGCQEEVAGARTQLKVEWEFV